MTTPWIDYGRGGYSDQPDDEELRKRRARLLGPLFPLQQSSSQMPEPPAGGLPAREVAAQPASPGIQSGAGLPGEVASTAQGVPFAPGYQQAATAGSRIEPSMYGDYIRQQAPADDPNRQLTPEQILRRNVEDAQDPRSFKRKQGLWNRLGKGILAGLRDWSAAGAPGGPLGALGAIATGGTMFGLSNKITNEDDRRQELRGLFRDYQPYAALNKQENELLKDRLGNQQTILENEKKALDNVLTKYKVSIDQAMAMEEMPMDLAQALRNAGIPAFAQDWGQWEPSVDARGLPVIRRKKGTQGYQVDPTGTPDPSQAVIPITIKSPDGGEGTFYQKSGQAADTAARIARDVMQQNEDAERRRIHQIERADDRAFDIKKFNVEAANRYRLETSKAASEIAKQAANILGNVPGFEAHKQIYDSALADIDRAQAIIASKGAETPEYKDALVDLDKARERADKALVGATTIAGQSLEGANLLRQLRDLLPSAPMKLEESTTPAATPPAPKPGKKRYTDEDIRRITRQ